MTDNSPISGVMILQLSWQGERLVVLTEEDHLLRRFGQVDIVRLQPGTTLTTHRQQGADEIWGIVTGAASLILTDLREGSPTNQEKMEISISDESHQCVLIPFGVQAKLTCVGSGFLVRLTSHTDELTPNDKIFESGVKAD